MAVKSLNEIVELNSSFKSSVNLYLSLNKREKILSYIPTKSSVAFLNEYLKSVFEKKEQASLMVGPYGKGKSHLLLLLLSILSLERDDENGKIIEKVIEKISDVDEIGEETATLIEKIWKKPAFLPVIIIDSQGDLNQSFLFALAEALKRENLSELIPDTYYSIAISRIEDWKENYPDTYKAFESIVNDAGSSINELTRGLRNYSRDSLITFKDVYPKITAGSDFNPMAASEVLPLYKSTSEKLKEEYGYSGLYIVFDEFSKFVEGQNEKSTGNNMKLLQDICELATDSQNSQVFFTMVAHKSIKEYGKYLSQDIINSFTGIEGRIVEKRFITSSKNNYELIRSAIIKDDEKLKELPGYEGILGSDAIDTYYTVPYFKSNFNRSDFSKILLKGCFPLNPICSYLLLNISEKVAQNERTLFTFISNDEPNSMARYIKEHTDSMPWVIGADLIYDYFSGLFKKEISNEYIHNEWLNAEYALSKCDSVLQEKVIKTLAVFLIVGKEEEMPATRNFIEMAAGLSAGSETISELDEKQLIYCKAATNCYAFKTRAGSALKNEIKNRREIKGLNVDYNAALCGVLGRYSIVPKKFNADNSMTRYFNFEFIASETFLNIESADSLFSYDENADGKALFVYDFCAVKQSQIKKHLADLASPNLVVICPTKALKIRNELRDYEILQDLKQSNVFTNSNEILQREIPLLEEDLILVIEKNVHDVETDNECRAFRYNGEKIVSYKHYQAEKAVSDACTEIYSMTPIINNELINRRSITTAQTRKARQNIISAILSHTDDEEFYSGSNQEATIYRSLFCVTEYNDNPSQALKSVIELMNAFVDNCSDTKTSMRGLINQLTRAPYGMRMGVLPVYLAKVFASRREDFIVYFEDQEVQINPEIVTNMCERCDDYSLFVSKEDVQKEKYIGDLNVLFHVGESINLSDNRIKDILICMQRWFRALPAVSRNISRNSKYDIDEAVLLDMIKIRNIMQKYEVNPFEVVFVKVPEAFECAGDFATTFLRLDACVTAFEDYCDWVVNKAVEATYEVFGGKKKKQLYHVVKDWYDKQSDVSKNGLHGGRITNLMTCLEKLNVFSDQEVAKKVVKAVTDVYIENWSNDSIDSYLTALVELKASIENIKEDTNKGNCKLIFTGKDGQERTKYFERNEDGSGYVLRNVIEDALDEFSDLSVNDRVAILLEMIEKVIG